MRLRRILFSAALGLACRPANAATAALHPRAARGQADARYKKGRALAAQKDFAAAAAEFEAAVRLDPKFGEAYYWLGISDFGQDKSEAAIADFKKALADTRDAHLLSLIHYDLGMQYMKIGAPTAADAEYKSAVLLDPELSRYPIAAPLPAAPPAKPRLVWVVAAAFLILFIAIAVTASHDESSAAH